MKQVRVVIMLGGLVLVLCRIGYTEGENDSKPLATKTFEGSFAPNEDIPVGITMATPDQPAGLEVIKVRFETHYGNAWGCMASLRWRGDQTGWWRISLELMDGNGAVLFHPNDRPCVFVTSPNPQAGASGPPSAELEVGIMHYERRLHAKRFTLCVHRLNSNGERVKLDRELPVRVVDDSSGRPLDRAVVLVCTWDRSTDSWGPKYLYVIESDGRLRIQVPGSASQQLIMEAQQPGYASLVAQFEGGYEWPAEYTLRLPPAARIGGIVRDQDGRPIANVYVGVSARQAYESGLYYIYRKVRTDSQGRWVVESIPQELAKMEIRLTHPQYRTAQRYGSSLDAADLKEARQLNRIDRMAKGLSVDGIVHDDQGQPIQEATVHLIPGEAGQFGYAAVRSLTDGSGRFSFGCGSAGLDGASVSDGGSTVLLVEALGYTSAVKKISLTQDVAGIEFSLARGRALAGKVVDTKGTLLADAWIVVHPFPDRSWYSLWQRPTDSQGRFSLDHVPDQVLITVGRRGYITVRDQPFPPASGEPVICMRPAVHVTGKVTDSATGQLIPNVEVAVSKPDRADRIAEQSDIGWERSGDGRYEKTLDEAFDGDRVLAARVDGYRPAASKAFTMEQTNVEIDLTLTADPSYKIQSWVMPQGFLLKGLVVDPNGRPAPGVAISAYNWVSEGAVTAADGTFILVFPAQECMGQCMVVARDMQRNLAAAIDSAELAAAGKIQLEPGMRLTGKVQDPNGRGIRDAQFSMTLWFSDTGYGKLEKVTIAEDGGFVIPAIAQGNRYSIDAKAQGYGTGDVEIEASEDRTQVDLATIVLPVADQSLAGVVVDQDSNPVAKIRVGAMGRGQPFLETMTDEKGRFSFQGLVQGTVTIQSNTRGIPRLHGKARVQAGDPNVRIIAFEVDENGRPVLPRPKTLLGKAMPDLKDLGLTLADASDKPLLVCFMDIEQRPSRRYLSELAKKVEGLSAKGVTVVVVQVSKVGLNRYEEWIKANQITFPIHKLECDFEAKKVAWGVKALPWLILTDKEHVVVAEGFAINELDKVLDRPK